MQSVLSSVALLPHALLRQYVHFCTSKASKVGVAEERVVAERAEQRRVAASVTSEFVLLVKHVN